MTPEPRCAVCNADLGIGCSVEPRPDCPRTQFLTPQDVTPERYKDWSFGKLLGAAIYPEVREEARRRYDRLVAELDEARQEVASATIACNVAVTQAEAAEGREAALREALAFAENLAHMNADPIVRDYIREKMAVLAAVPAADPPLENFTGGAQYIKEILTFLRQCPNCMGLGLVRDSMRLPVTCGRCDGRGLIKDKGFKE